MSRLSDQAYNLVSADCNAILANTYSEIATVDDLFTLLADTYAKDRKSDAARDMAALQQQGREFNTFLAEFE